jgi:hypothetical protein
MVCSGFPSPAGEGLVLGPVHNCSRAERAGGFLNSYPTSVAPIFQKKAVSRICSKSK